MMRLKLVTDTRMCHTHAQPLARQDGNGSACAQRWLLKRNGGPGGVSVVHALGEHMVGRQHNIEQITKVRIRQCRARPYGLADPDGGVRSGQAQGRHRLQDSPGHYDPAPAARSVTRRIRRQQIGHFERLRALCRLSLCPAGRVAQTVPAPCLASLAQYPEGSRSSG